MRLSYDTLVVMSECNQDDAMRAVIQWCNLEPYESESLTIEAWWCGVSDQVFSGLTIRGSEGYHDRVCGRVA